jgi:tight adherence protein C
VNEVPLWVVGASALVVTSVIGLLWAVSGFGKTEGPGAARALGIDEGPTDQRKVRLQAPAWERFLRPWLDSTSRRIRQMTPAGWVDALDRRLKLAGSPPGWPTQRVLGIKLALGITTLIVVVFAVDALSIETGNLSLTFARWAAALVLSVGAYFLPDLLINARARERQEAIQRTMSDTLDQMTISVEAGLGFDAALHRVVQSGEGPLVEELKRTLNEIAIGVGRREAFQNLLERTEVTELRHFVFAVTQAEEYGVPIAQVLNVQAKELRVMRRQRAEERALKIPVKIVMPLVICILPSLFIVILVPAAIRIFDALL